MSRRRRSSGVRSQTLGALRGECVATRPRDRAPQRPYRKEIAGPAPRTSVGDESIDRIAIACPRSEHGQRTSALGHYQTLAGSHTSQVAAEVLPQLAYPDAITHY